MLNTIQPFQKVAIKFLKTVQGSKPGKHTLNKEQFAVNAKQADFANKTPKVSEMSERERLNKY